MVARTEEDPRTAHPSGVVCVIDGDQGVRNSLRTLLGTLGVEVRAFSRAEEFLLWVERGRPSCLITEVSLSGMSGFELMDTLRAKGVRLPTIGVTLEADPENIREAARVGLLDLVEKPFVYRPVVERVREALGLPA